jgi:transposase-like protein
MARTPPASHTRKQPERCPYCASRSVTRRGTRKKKLEVVQLWRCGSCKRVFTPAPDALRHKTYPLRTILEAITDYNLGYSLTDAAARLKSKRGLRVSPSTIANWLHEHQSLTSYRRLRDRGKSLFRPNTTIRAIKLYHRQIYEYSYHRAKLEFVRDGSLDDKRAGSTQFAKLADFLESIPTTCPHDLFRDSEARASQLKSDLFDPRRIIVNRKDNAATRTAALVLPTIGNNFLRHGRLQRFMLANDSVTVTVEVPIWLNEADIAALERQHGVELVPRDGNKPRIVTGHIDFLQVRNGALHILDYKPDARTNKPIAQLAIYALALTRLVPGLKLFDIKCAWFNEDEYCEMFPRTLFIK